MLYPRMAPMLYRLLLSRSVAVAAAAAILLLLLPLSATATNFEYCDDSADYSVKIKSVHISKKQVASGWKATFNVSASTRDKISAGNLQVFIVCAGTRYGDTHDICHLTKCPIPTGDFKLRFKEVLPGSCRLGVWIERDQNMLTCFFVDFEAANMQVDEI